MPGTTTTLSGDCSRGAAESRDILFAVNRCIDAHHVRVGSNVLWYLSVPSDGAPEFETLTAAEKDVAARVAGGAPNAEVARARGTSVRTVANQLRAIYAKLGVCDRHELMSVAFRRYHSR